MIYFIATYSIFLFIGILYSFVLKKGKKQPKVELSVIIPFRNEEKSIQGLINSIKKQKDQPEIIFVNDHSNDESVSIVEKFVSKEECFHLLHLKESSGKKAAIQLALSKARNKRILQIDADVRFDENLFDVASTCTGDFSTAWVRFEEKKSFINHFQVWENLATMLMTKLSIDINIPLMSNGANMVFSNKGNHNVNEKYASGDDVFLMYDIKSKGGNVEFDIERTVITEAADNFKSFFNQRRRWIGKSQGVKSLSFRLLSIIVLIAQLSPISLLIVYSDKLFYVLLLKTVVELTGMILVNRYLAYKSIFISYLWVVLIYPFYLIMLLFSSLFYKTNWKGRPI